MLLSWIGLIGAQTQTDKIMSTVTDIDGNVYKTVTIGTQIWMAENLKTTRYRNGDPIGTTTPANLDVSGENAPKYQWSYAGNDSIAAIYGKLYTWFAVTDNRSVCPSGWHMPSYQDFTTLINFLGGASTARGKLKETGTTHWESPNIDASNESGFTAIPGGSHWTSVFVAISMYGHLWSAEMKAPGWAWRLALSYQDMDVNTVLNTADPKIGWSVRCLKDAQNTQEFPVLKDEYLGQKPPGTVPEIFAPGIITREWERFPVVSPDGKYLFFTRGGSDKSNLFWVSTKIIDDLKKESLK